MLHNGVYIGQFGQGGWNIHDMSPYENRKPRYVRDWYLKLRTLMKANKLKRDEEEAEEASPGKTTKAEEPDHGDDISDKSLDYQEKWDNDLADEIEFSEEEEEDDNGITLKGAA